MNIKIITLCLVFFGLASCSTSKPGANTPEVEMIKVSVMYAGGPDKTFDMDYYETRHMPMMAQILGKNLKYYEVDKGTSGRTLADQPTYVAMCHFYCYDAAAYDKAVSANIEAIRSDIGKYTNIQPVIQKSKVTQVSNSK